MGKDARLTKKNESLNRVVCFLWSTEILTLPELSDNYEFLESGFIRTEIVFTYRSRILRNTGTFLKLKSASPFWPLKNGLPFSYPALRENLSCDVAIIGGGLCGSMVAYHLAEAGIDAVLLDKRDIANGSSSASTALVMYEIDVLLKDLVEMRGEKYAVKSYNLCLQSTKKIEHIVKKLGGDIGFRRKNSLYLASRVADSAILRKEYETRKKYGFKLDYLDREDIENNFSFSRPAALLSYDDAEVDPYLLSHFLLDHSRKNGLQVYDRTEATKFVHTKNGISLATEQGFHVQAKKVVFATGYETPDYIKKNVVKLKSTYAIVSEPLPDFVGWGYDHCLIWESARPYLYMRTTTDGRIMVGGEDEDFVNPTKRDGLIPRKAIVLMKKTKKLFPNIDFQIAYSWAGTFGETVDGLPYVGEVREFSDAYFALCYGANGTNFALMGAEIIRDLYLGKSNPKENIFRFSR
jgi:glycine/D-amino acid oxidase-like deaminating enzyme